MFQDIPQLRDAHYHPRGLKFFLITGHSETGGRGWRGLVVSGVFQDVTLTPLPPRVLLHDHSQTTSWSPSY